MTPRTVSRRQLGRATLARQLLLDRATVPAVTAMERTAGLQAQAPLAPYVGLWSRLRDFQAVELADALSSYAVVRTHAMRSTIHLLTAEDVLRFRGAFAPLHQANFASTGFARRLAGVDEAAVVAAGGALLEGGALTRSELGHALSEQFPGADAEALAYAVTYRVALLQPPPRGLWGGRSRATWQALEPLLGKEIDRRPDLAALVRRYLLAFGPASVADAQTWSGLTRLAEVFDAMPLVAYRTEGGATVYDLPESTLPDEDTPAPVRFLPEYDNVLLSHADRSRVNPYGRPIPLPPGEGARVGTVLVDGELRGTWTWTGSVVEMTTDPALSRSESADVAREAEALAAFLAT